MARYNKRFTRQGHRTGIVLDFTRETIRVEGVTRRFHRHELIVLEFWLRLHEAGITPQDHAEAAELLSEPPVARTAQESELGHR